MGEDNTSSSATNPYVGIALLASMMVMVAGIVVAVFIAGQRPIVIVVSGGGPDAVVSAGDGAVQHVDARSGRGPAETDVAAAPAQTTQAVASTIETQTAEADASAAVADAYVVRAARVSQLPAIDDVFAESWQRAASLEVALEPQMITGPMLEQATVESVEVRALSDGHTIAWRLSWEADEPASGTETGRFSDAAAIQFPLVEHASFMMGSPEAPVQILYWKALWEKDLELGFQDVTDLYPNTWSDMYWFAQGEPPFRADEAFEDEWSQQWFVAERAGNPQSQRDRAQPVEEMVAEGFGTLTTLGETYTAGYGTWRDGRWTVVLARPLALEGDRLADRLANGGEQQMALAIWDGSAGNVGGRKHWSAWVPFEVMP